MISDYKLYRFRILFFSIISPGLLLCYSCMNAVEEFEEVAKLNEYQIGYLDDEGSPIIDFTLKNEKSLCYDLLADRKGVIGLRELGVNSPKDIRIEEVMLESSSKDGVFLYITGYKPDGACFLIFLPLRTSLNNREVTYISNTSYVCVGKNGCTRCFADRVGSTIIDCSCIEGGGDCKLEEKEK